MVVGKAWDTDTAGKEKPALGGLSGQRGQLHHDVDGGLGIHAAGNLKVALLHGRRRWGLHGHR